MGQFRGILCFAPIWWGTLVPTGASRFFTLPEESCVHDQFDVTLEDGVLLSEVELTTNLIIAASEAEGPLTPEEIDEILGVTPPPAT